MNFLEILYQEIFDFIKSEKLEGYKKIHNVIDIKVSDLIDSLKKEIRKKYEDDRTVFQPKDKKAILEDFKDGFISKEWRDLFQYKGNSQAGKRKLRINCLVEESVTKNLLEQKKIKPKSLDYYAVFLGYKGWNDFQKCKIKEKQLVKPKSTKKTKQTEKKKISFLNELEEIIDKNKPKKPHNIPYIKKQYFFKRFIFSLKSFFNNELNYQFNRQPLALLKNDIEAMTENYVRAYFQLNESIFDIKKPYYNKAGKENQPENIINYLERNVLNNKNEPHSRKAKYYFILAESGIGKTTLLLELYVKARKKGFNWDKIYFLPFSKWNELNSIPPQEKENTILLLDALDEDFTLSGKKEDFERIIDKFKDATKEFDKVIITSRNQFFRDKNIIDYFTYKVGKEINLSYKIIALAPFTTLQTDEFLKKKFNRDKKTINDAKKVIRIIGKDTANRQLLISKIDLLVKKLKTKRIINEIKEFTLFDFMLQEWLFKEQKFKIDGLNKEQTWKFSKVLAKKLFEEKEENPTGFTFEYLKELPEIKNIKKSHLLTNRTYLVLGSDNKYRFAHKSIYEFFLAQVAVENEVFDESKVFIEYKNNKENIFINKMYEQFIASKFNTLFYNNNVNSFIHYTTNTQEAKQYGKDMRFEPFYIEGLQPNIKKRRWTTISNLKNNLSTYKKIKGIKFICNVDNEENRLNIRKKSLNSIKALFRFIPNLMCLDLSEMDLTDDEFSKIDSLKIKILNLRENNLINIKLNIKFTSGMHQLKDGSWFSNTKYNKSEYYYNIRNNNFSKEDDFYGNFIINYSKKLFSYFLEKTNLKRRIDEYYIFLSHQDLEKGKDYLEDVNKIRVLSKVRGFECLFFTEDKVLTEKEIMECFPNVQNNRLKTNKIEYYIKAKNYTTFIGVNQKINHIKDGLELHILKNNDNTIPININIQKIDLIQDKIKSIIFEEMLLCQAIIKYHSKFKNIETITLNFTKDIVPPYKDEYDYHTEGVFGLYRTHPEFSESVKTFTNIKHLFVNTYSNTVQDFNTINYNILNSLFYEFKDNTLVNYPFDFIKAPNLKKFGVTFWGANTVIFDFTKINIQASLNKLVVSKTKGLSELINLINIFKSESLLKIVLEFKTLKVLDYTNHNITNDVLEHLTISYNLVEILIKNRIVFKNLSYLKIINDSSSKFEEYLYNVETTDLDLIFINRMQSLKTLIISNVNRIINHKLLINSQIKSLEISFNLSVSENEFITSFEELIQTINSSNIEELKMTFIFKDWGFDNKMFTLLNKVKKMTLFNLEFGLTHIGKENTSIKFDFNDVLNFKKLNILLNYKSVFLDINLEMLFDSLYKSVVKNLLIETVLIDDINIPKRFLSERILNLIEFDKYKLITKDTFYNVFLDSKYSVLSKRSNITSLPYKHIRFINTFFENELLLGIMTIFNYVEKLSFSSLVNINLETLLAIQLKEIELLTYYLKESEFEKIEIYKSIIENQGVKFSENSNKFIIKEDKGLLETEYEEIEISMEELKETKPYLYNRLLNTQK